jgi:hypothetical protein
MFATLPDGRQKPPVTTKEAAKPSRIVPLPKAVAETKSVWTQPPPGVAILPLTVVVVAVCAVGVPLSVTLMV